MGFGGPGLFTVYNSSKLNIKKIRLSHFLSGKEYADRSEIVLLDELKSGAKSSEKYTFHSYDGKTDHWCIEFVNEKGAWMSGNLKKSMKADYKSGDYELKITDKKFTVTCVKKDGSTTSDSKDIKILDEII